jgi:hypothetical protein
MGDKVACRGHTHNVAICIGKEFSINCYTIQLGSFDVVLGVEYLRTLGPILWDFDDLCMLFWRGDRHVYRKGVGSPRGDILQPSLRSMVGQQPTLMDRILLEFASVFDEP